MKNFKSSIPQLRLGIILFSIILITECRAQERYHVGIGGTYSINNTVKDVIDNAGLYVNFGTTGTLKNSIGYLGELQLVNQNSKPAKINSVNATFMFTAGERLSAGLGFNLSMSLSEDLPAEGGSFKGHGMAGVAQLAYNLSDNYQFQVRYNHFVDGDLNKMIQAGLNYRF